MYYLYNLIYHKEQMQQNSCILEDLNSVHVQIPLPYINLIFFFPTYKFKKILSKLEEKKKTFYTIDNYLESKRVKIKNFLKQHASPSLVIKSEASKINWDFLGFKLITPNFDFKRNKPKGDSKLRYSQNNMLVSNTQITFLL